MIFGEQNFKKEILYIFDNETDMNAKEKEIVTEEFIKLDSNYNICPGGKGGFGYINSNGLSGYKIGYVNSRIKLKEKYGVLYPSQVPAAKQKLSLIMKDRHAEGIVPIPPIFTKHSDKSIEKMKLAKVGHGIGVKNSQYGTCWVTNSKENKKIKKTELDKWLLLGYTKGRKIR